MQNFKTNKVNGVGAHCVKVKAHVRCYAKSLSECDNLAEYFGSMGVSRLKFEKYKLAYEIAKEVHGIYENGKFDDRDNGFKRCKIDNVLTKIEFEGGFLSVSFNKSKFTIALEKVETIEVLTSLYCEAYCFDRDTLEFGVLSVC